MPAVQNVLIIGGGIGGLACATAIARRGLEVDVVEVRTAHDVLGVGIIQPGNALRALKSIGLLDACLNAGFQSDDYVYFDQHENELARLKMRRIADPDLPAVNFLPRPALHDILDAAARQAGASIRMGTTVSAMDQDATGVAVTCSDGSRKRYDLVIGADGIRSTTRSLLFGDAVAPQYTGHGVWRVTVPRPADQTFQSIHYGIGAKAGLVPLTHDLMYLLLVTNAPERPWYASHELAGVLREHLRPFDGPRVSAVRDGLNADSKVLYTAIEEVILPAPWFQGRIALIGDAAHASGPHIAQGASMAIEDGCVMADELAKHQPLETALDAFMARRYERCKFVQDFSRKMGEEGQLTDPDECLARNERFKVMFATETPQPRPHEKMLGAPI